MRTRTTYLFVQNIKCALWRTHKRHGHKLWKKMQLKNQNQNQNIKHAMKSGWAIIFLQSAFTFDANQFICSQLRFTLRAFIDMSVYADAKLAMNEMNFVRIPSWTLICSAMASHFKSISHHSHKHTDRMRYAPHFGRHKRDYNKNGLFWFFCYLLQLRTRWWMNEWGDCCAQ